MSLYSFYLNYSITYITFAIYLNKEKKIFFSYLSKQQVDKVKIKIDAYTVLYL